MPTGNDLHHHITPAGRRGRGLLAAGLALILLGAAGCRRDMYDQPKYDAYDPSTFFRDGSSSRQQVVGTVARGDLEADPLYYQGKIDGKDADVFPFAIDRETLELGRERYLIYCSPCHSRAGDGRGMVVRRGFSPPPTFHSEYLRKRPVGHFFEVITHGYGAMYSYASRIPVRHRWAIIAYIRAMQYSREASMDDLTPDEQKNLANPPAAGQTTTEDHRAGSAEAAK